MELNDAILEKAKNAKVPEELLSLARENGVDLTEKEAESYFARLNSKEGELSDDELDSVAGGRKCGTMYYDHRPVVTIGNSCGRYRDEKTKRYDTGNGKCGTCFYSKVFDIFLTCNHHERYEN